LLITTFASTSHISLCNYAVLKSVLICLWVCGWAILALHQSAVLGVEQVTVWCRNINMLSQIVAHLTDCDMDCMG